MDFPDSFWVVRTVSGWSGSFLVVWTVSRLSAQFLIFWTFSGLFGQLLDCADSFNQSSADCESDDSGNSGAFGESG